MRPGADRTKKKPNRYRKKIKFVRFSKFIRIFVTDKEQLQTEPPLRAFHPNETMQHKKTYLQRLLAIYVAFFAVLLAALGHEVIPDFFRGHQDGMAISGELVREFDPQKPRAIYLLFDIPITEAVPAAVETADSTRRITACPTQLRVQVDEPAAGRSIFGLAFEMIGGSKWFYALTLLNVLAYLAIIILMWLIIRSVRRSIREETPIGRADVWRLRTIALLTIVSELFSSLWNWGMARNAARLLTDTAYTVDASFDLSYGVIMMGILLLFAAEIFAIGRDLGEEQRLTI